MHRKYWELWKEETKAVCLDTSNATMTLSRNILARELVVLYSITSSVRVNNCQYLYNSIRKDIRTEDSNGCLSRAGISSQLLSFNAVTCNGDCSQSHGRGTTCIKMIFSRSYLSTWVLVCISPVVVPCCHVFLESDSWMLDQGEVAEYLAEAPYPSSPKPLGLPQRQNENTSCLRVSTPWRHLPVLITWDSAAAHCPVLQNFIPTTGLILPNEHSA